MLNPMFMKSLAKLESVANPADRDTINAVRGLYVKQFGANEVYVDKLNRLESVACSQSERDEINTIRGKYGLMVLTEKD